MPTRDAIIDLPSFPHFYTTHNSLPKIFEDRSKLREAFDDNREGLILKDLRGHKGWRATGKASYLHDDATNIVYRRSQKGRVTTCVPHKLAFHVAAREHIRSHRRRGKPHDIDSDIARKYTGITRDHLQLMREHCCICKTEAGSYTSIPLDFSRLVENLLGTTGPPDQSDAATGDDECYDSIFWIGFKESKPGDVPTQMIQHSHSAAENSSLIPDCFSRITAEQLKVSAGPTFFSMDNEGAIAHQSIVTMSFMSETMGRDVNFHTNEWLENELMQDPSTLGPRALLVLAFRQYDHSHTAVQQLCARVKERTPEGTRTFPSADELEHDHGKLGDIRALDQIADHAPKQWSFRPLTCENNALQCLVGEAGVLKRTHSCSSLHVILKPTELHLKAHLLCSMNQCSPRNRRRSQRKSQTIEQWFHQELVKDLRELGEFRVFIVTQSDPKALRGRRGEIVEIIHTLELPNRDLIVTVLSTNSNWRDKFPAFDKELLHEFALYNFDKLRGRSDWSTNFESLEVGVRLDIGLSRTEDSYYYFVNEITRIYSADFFAEWLAQPGTHICREVALAMRDVFVEQPGLSRK